MKTNILKKTTISKILSIFLLLLFAAGTICVYSTEADATDAADAAAVMAEAQEADAADAAAVMAEAQEADATDAAAVMAEAQEADAADAADTAEAQRYVLAFTGDQHGETDTYQEWIESVKAVYGDDLTLVSYSGDICDKSWEPEVYEGFASMLEELLPGKYNITTGNQEFKSGAPGPSWDSLGEGYTRIGEVLRTDAFIVYNLGSAQEKMLLPDADLEQLAAYLEEVPDNLPVFILAHYPLHLSTETEDHDIPGPDAYRYQTGNDKLIDVLNNYPNVIFLWGHNHTFEDPRYGTIRPAGSKITYTDKDPSAKKEMDFIYANYGSFCRGDTYGIIAEIVPEEDGIHVSLYFVDTDVPDETRDSAAIVIGNDGSVSAEIQQGTAVNLEEILAMSGYPDDPAFAEEY